MSTLQVTIDGQSFTIELDASYLANAVVPVSVAGETVLVQQPDPDWLIIDGRPYEIAHDESLRWIKAYSGLHQVEVRDLEETVARPRSRDGRVKAPIPGMVTRVLVRAGEEIAADQPLFVLEAMKMENEIRAPRAGRVTAVHVQPQQTVIRSEVLAEIS